MRGMVVIAAVMLSLPMIAGEVQDQKLQPAPPDSPLVAAAKSVNRHGKKRLVITNANLKTAANSKAHVTTTTISSSINIPAATPSREDVAYQARQQQRADEAGKAEIARKADAEREQRMRRMAAERDDQGPYGETDPAAADRQPEQSGRPEAPKKP